MKFLFIIYNILFLFLGSELFAQIHHHHHHHHHDHLLENHDCEECLNFNNDESVIIPNKNNFSVFNIDQIVLEEFNTIYFNQSQKYLSRAPPISSK